MRRSHLDGFGLPAPPSIKQLLGDYFSNNYWAQGNSNPMRQQSGWGKLGGADNAPDPFKQYSEGFDFNKWLSDFGYKSLNNFPAPKMGWYGMGGMPQGGQAVPWWNYFTGGQSGLT